VGESVTVRVAATPVPERATVCGDPVALSATDKLAVFAPADGGLNSIETVQVALAASEAPHVVADFTNDVALVPVRVSEVSVTADVPVFLMVTSCAAVVTPAGVDANVRLAGDKLTLSAAAVAAPVSATVCGEPVALSATERLPVKVPAAVGLNSTETVHVAPAANDVVQVFAEIRYEDALVPVSVSEVRVTAAVPVFFTVTVCAADVEPTVVEAKVSAVGDSVTVSAAAVPDPVNVTVCGEPVALSAIDRLPVSVPAAVGLNSIETVQLALAASDVVHVLAEIRYEEAFVPVSVSEVNANAAVPVFFTVTTCAAEVAPTVVEAKVRVAGVSDTAGPEPPDPPVTV
jgi:hypothetical protein